MADYTINRRGDAIGNTLNSSETVALLIRMYVTRQNTTKNVSSWIEKKTQFMNIST